MHLFIPIFFFSCSVLAIVSSPVSLVKRRKPRSLPKLILFIDDDPYSTLPVKRITGE